MRLKRSDFPKLGKYRHTAHYWTQKGEKLERRNSTSLHERWSRVLSSLLWHVKCSAKYCFVTTEKNPDLSFTCVCRGRLPLNVCKNCNPVSVFDWRKSNPLFLLLFSLGLAVNRYMITWWDVYCLVLTWGCLLLVCWPRMVFRHMAGVGTIDPWVPFQAGSASCHPAPWAPGLPALTLVLGCSVSLEPAGLLPSL